MRKTVLGQLLRLLQLLILAVLYLFIKMASKAPSVVDSLYSQKIYPAIRNAVSAVTRTLPFSLCEFIAAILIALAVILLIIRIIKLILFRKEALVRLVSLLVTMVLICSYLVVAFYVMWGFNLYRTTAAEKFDLPEGEFTSEQLRALCDEFASKASELRSVLQTDDEGVFTGELDNMNTALHNGYSVFGASRPSFKADVPPVKPVIGSELLSKCGISGIYVFLTEEANVNTDEPFLYIPFNAAHELAHYLGYAREEDANFIAFLVCIGSDDASLQYSAYMHALTHFSNALYAADKQSHADLSASYSEGMKKDLADYSAYYSKYSGTKIYEKANNINDNYLKFNGEEKGALSYEEDVALILRYYKSIGFFGSGI